MIYFSDVYDALEYLKKNREDTEDRKIAFKYLQINCSYVLSFLSQNCFINNCEKKAAIWKCLREPGTSLTLIENNVNLLDEHEIEIAFEVILENPTSAYRLLSFNNQFRYNPKFRQRIIDAVAIDKGQLNNLLKSTYLFENEKMDLLQKFEQFDYVMENYLIYNKANNQCREFAFNKIITNDIACYRLAQDGYLLHHEKVKVHDLYSKLYISQIKGAFKEFKQYCYVFRNILNVDEQKLLAKKLTCSTRQRYIDYFLNNCNLDTNIREQLVSYKVAYRISGSSK
jgi:hypothetical protein